MLAAIFAVVNYWKKRERALWYSLQGLAASVRRESHMRIHLLAALIVIIAGMVFKIERWEWIALSACIVLVIVCELFNTAIEKLCDRLSPEIHPAIKYIKDICAAAVLVACLFAIVTGLIIFGPRIMQMIGEF